MDSSTPTLRDLLRKHKYQSGKSDADIAADLQISQASVSNLIRGKTQNLHERTRISIEDYLKNNGLMTRLGFPSIQLEQEELPTSIDRSALRGMGIGQIDVPVTQLNALEKSVVIQGVMNSRCIDSPEKLRIIQHLFPSL